MTTNLQSIITITTRVIALTFIVYAFYLLFSIYFQMIFGGSLSGTRLVNIQGVNHLRADAFIQCCQNIIASALLYAIAPYLSRLATLNQNQDCNKS